LYTPLLTMTYPESELIINNDGSCFHLHVKPEQLADRVILVGDPGRVKLVASHFESIECEIENREFRTITGNYRDANGNTKRITVVSTGIGCDNIDIVVNELDALANINFETREDHPEHRTLTLVRIGTCGGLHADLPTGTFIASEKSLGFDGLLNFYGGRNTVCDLEFEEAFLEHMHWTGNQCIAHPYCINNCKDLLEQIARDDMARGVTIACGGFYGPQGRVLRAPLADPNQNAKIEAFRYTPKVSAMNPEPHELRFTNFEMESSAVAGLSALLGHRALTVCMVVANRKVKAANTEYKGTIDLLIQTVLERI